MSACGPWCGPKRAEPAVEFTYVFAFWRDMWQFMQSLPAPPSFTTVPSFSVTSVALRTSLASVEGAVWPCDSWHAPQVTAVYSVRGEAMPLLVSMKPLPVWQPTQPSRPAPDGSRVTTACAEAFHSRALMWFVPESWQKAQEPELCGFEISMRSPPDFTCWLPGPWQLSHWMLARFWSLG